MSYSSVANVRLASGFSDSDNVTDAYITAKIVGADALIDSKVGERYSLPLDSTPDLIEFLSIEITVALLFIDQYGEETEDKDKGWKKRLDFLMKMLEEIRNGKLKLYDSTTGAEFARSEGKLPSSYPTATSSDESATDSTAPKVTMNKKF